MAFLSTSNVDVFPSALRKEGLGNYTTENNISNLIRMTTSNNSFVDEVEVDKTTGNFNLTVVIHGYTFKLTNVSKDYKYACILIDNNGMLVNYSDGSTKLDDEKSGCMCISLEDSLDSSLNWTESRGEYRASGTKTIDNNNVKFQYYALKFYDGTNIINTNKTSVSSLEGGPFGSDTQPIYINNSGAPKPCTNVAAKTAESLTTNSVGSAMAIDSEGVGTAVAEPVFIDNNGKPVSSNLKIIISKDAPTGEMLTDNLIWLQPMPTT